MVHKALGNVLIIFTQYIHFYPKSHKEYLKKSTRILNKLNRYPYM